MSSKEQPSYKELEQKVRQLDNEVNFYKLIADNTYDWESFYNTSGKIIYVNEAFEQITGYSCEAMLDGSLTVTDVIHPDDQYDAGISFKKALDKQIITDFEFRIIRKDKEIRHINLCATPVYQGTEFAGVRSSARDITQQKDFLKLQKLHQELVDSKKKFKNYIESSPTAVFISNAAGKYSYANPSACKLLGYSQNDLLQLSIPDIIHNEDHTTALQSHAELIEKGVTHDLEIRLKKKNGETAFILLDGKRLGEDEFIAFVKDISDRKEAEFQLKKQRDEYESLSEEYSATIEELHELNEHILSSDEALRLKNKHLSGIIEGTRAGTWQWNVQTGETIFNDRWAEMIGYTLDEISPVSIETWKALTHPDDFTRANELLEKHFAGLLDYFEVEFRMKHKNGHWVWVKDRGKIIEYTSEGTPLLMYGTHMEITREKKHEEMLRSNELLLKEKNEEYEALNEELCQANEQLFDAKVLAEKNEKKYRNIFEKAPVGIFRTDSKGKPLMVNDTMARMLGINSAEEALKHYTNLGEQLYLHPERREEFKRLLKKQGSVQNFEYQAKTLTGHKLWLSMNASIQQTEEDGVFYIEGFTSDITERKIAEARLIEAKEKAEESDRLKTVFLQNMSHEIRTPMNGIIGFADMLCKPDITPEQRVMYTSIINKSTHQLLSVVSDILAISALETKQEKITVQPVLLNRMIEHLDAVFESKAAEKNISLNKKTTLPDAQAEIYTDNTKLTQILTNLLSNAIKFTHEGFVEFGYMLKDNEEEPELEFYVKDTGIGIKPELQENVFERFCQGDLTNDVSYGGTGLGLSISKGFVEMLGGSIWIESQPGENNTASGTTFYFTIPYLPVGKRKKKKPTPGPIKSFSTVLIAEDEDINFQYLEAALSTSNLTILRAKNGREAVRICESMLELSLVLMDIKMPMMDGYSAAKQIKQMRPELPIIAQTAYALENEREQYSGNAFDDYLTKPITKEDLLYLLKSYIE